MGNRVSPLFRPWELERSGKSDCVSRGRRESWTDEDRWSGQTFLGSSTAFLYKMDTLQSTSELSGQVSACLMRNTGVEEWWCTLAAVTKFILPHWLKFKSVAWAYPCFQGQSAERGWRKWLCTKRLGSDKAAIVVDKTEIAPSNWVEPNFYLW